MGDFLRRHLSWKRLLGPVAGGAIGYAVSYLSTCAGGT